MKRNLLNLILTLASAFATPSLNGMHYKAPSQPAIILHPSIPTLSLIPSSACIGNTIAVGFEEYTGGFRLLCADAGQIGFWTTPVPARLAGVDDHLKWKWLCPSGTALVGYVQDESGLRQAACSELVPIVFSTGEVHTASIVSSVNTVLSPIGVVACPVNKYVQRFEALTSPAGAVTGFVSVCNAVETDIINIHTLNLPAVDLAVRTVGQPALKFEVDLYNLGFETVVANDVAVEFRYDAALWDVIFPSGMTCADIASRVIGGHDVRTLGKRCSIPGSAVKGLGNDVEMTITMQPLGSGTSTAATAGLPLVTVKAVVRKDSPLIEDGNPTNDVAAFPSSF